METKKSKSQYVSNKELKAIAKSNAVEIKRLEKRKKRKHVPEAEYLTELKEPGSALEIDNLHTYFFTDVGVAKAVNGVSFNVPHGSTVGVVGESGCGKSVTSLSILQLVQAPQGQIVDGSIRFRTKDYKRDEKGELIPIWEYDQFGNIVIETIRDKKKVKEYAEANKYSLSEAILLFDEFDSSLNTALFPEDTAANPQELLENRLAQVAISERQSDKVVCKWTISLPKSFETTEDEFFRLIFDFMSKRYKQENIVLAYISKNTTASQLHFFFIPVVTDKRGEEKIDADEKLSRYRVERFLRRFALVLIKAYDYKTGVLNDIVMLGKDGTPLIRNLQKKNKDGFKEFEQEVKTFDIAKMPINKMSKIRGKEISMIFQEPMTSLNPVFKIGYQLREAVLKHTPGITKEQAKDRCIEMLQLVGIAMAEHVYKSYPHQLSGGMRQRVMIAMSLSCNPKLIIADEPTTALDVTIQAQILELLRNIKDKTGTNILLITHDLGVIAEMADYVVVMYAGRVIEKGTVYDIFDRPLHPYTIGLQKSKPVVGGKNETLYSIPGRVPNPIDMPNHCYFYDRCTVRGSQCYEAYPKMTQVSDTHSVACYMCGTKVEEYAQKTDSSLTVNQNEKTDVSHADSNSAVKEVNISKHQERLEEYCLQDEYTDKSNSTLSFDEKVKKTAAPVKKKSIASVTAKKTPVKKSPVASQSPENKDKGGKA